MRGEQHAFEIRGGGTVGDSRQRFFLVRSVGCGNGTYDSGAPTQVGLRDAEINSNIAGCLP